MTKALSVSAFFMIVASTLMAYVPECPYFDNKKSCLEAVDENYDNTSDYINDEYFEDSVPPLIDAALDVKKFESLACERTCYN